MRTESREALQSIVSREGECDALYNNCNDCPVCRFCGLMIMSGEWLLKGRDAKRLEYAQELLIKELEQDLLCGNY